MWFCNQIRGAFLMNYMNLLVLIFLCFFYLFVVASEIFAFSRWVKLRILTGDIMITHSHWNCMAYVPHVLTLIKNHGYALQNDLFQLVK